MSLLGNQILLDNKNIFCLIKSQILLKQPDIFQFSILIGLLQFLVINLSMGGFLQKCCMSQSGTICCTIISILAIIYFTLTWAIFQSQYTFFEFHIPNKSDTRLSCLVSALIYVVALIWSLYRLHKMNKQKQLTRRKNNKKSISEHNNLPSVYEEESKLASKLEEWNMVRQK